MKLFHVSWNDPETVFHEMPWKKNFTVYPSLKKHIFFFQKQSLIDVFQKQPHVHLKNIKMFLEAATHKKISGPHFLSEAVVYWYLSEAAARSLRNIEMFLEAAAQSTT